MNIKISSSVVAGYMMLAFGWWALLLWRSNDEKLSLETQVLAHQKHMTPAEVMYTQDYAVLIKKHSRYEMMVIAEGLFFTCCLAFGIWLIRRTSQREVALARQRRNFLLSITHELKSPIAAMRLVLETFSKRELNREQSQKLSTGGLKDAMRLENLVQDLLLAARLEDSWRPLYTPISLYQLTEDCIEALKLRFPLSEVVNQIPHDFPEIQADKSGLTSVLMNLIENAIKYSPKGEQVKVQASALENGRFHLSVTDNGQGIPLAEQKAVFEKFYRLGNEETRQATGTGLGLYIVKQVVEAHGGTIEIKSNQPKGTVFHIEM